MKKRTWGVFVTAAALMMSLVLPASAEENHAVTVVINGVKVHGDATHMKSGQVWVDAEGYAELLAKDYSYNAKDQKFTINGHDLAAKIHKGKPSVPIREIAKATGAENVMWEGDIQQVYVLDLPDGTIALEPVKSVMDSGVPGMDQHWGNPADMPTGPIYGVEKGKLVFIEQMIGQEVFAKGESIVNIPGMKGMPSPIVEHTDIELVPNGHPGFEIPHYDIHHYFVTHEQHLKFSMPEGGAEPGHGGH